MSLTNVANASITIGESNNLVTLSASKLGIGLSNPALPLHVIGDARIQGNLTVNGSQTFIDTNVNTTERLDITNDGTGPALRVTQLGAQPIADFYDDSNVLAMRIADGGNVGIGLSNPTQKLDVAGNINLTGTVYKNGVAWNPPQVFTINLSSQSDATFYPIKIDNAPTMYTHYFSIEMPSQGNASTYNMHSLHAVARGQGWTDQSWKYEIFQNYYNTNERSILGIYRGTQNFIGVVVYLRGGQTYTILTNSSTVAAYTSAITFNDSVFALKNASGVDTSGTSANISQMWSGMGVEGKYYSHALTVNGTIQNINPAFCVASTTQVDYTNNTKITFTSVQLNDGGYFDTTLSRFTSPINGRYFVSFSGMSVGAYGAVYSLRKNGTVYGMYTYTEVVQYARGAMNWIVQLNINDYIEMWVGNGSFHYGTLHPSYNQFCGYLIG